MVVINKEVQGTVKEITGIIKEEAGKALNKPDMEARGKAEAFVGKAEKQLGTIERNHKH